ncbi:hypothetical protein A8924_2440 [Saccharopolyspora erythraea NRRL 2338]|uniref:Uncharacterized protein n=2 Tax=Saccharopolyspora erythraea TaxID=1836 RepID=A4FBC2_SACEN|nr:hypothetical protein [Saccharopolyspora erythraea]EQD86457.1 hypothetical protein N599_09390 [Saccharopolyspora erythraea D]PFG95129.1 hypothetical protein A8924_2440 [Saccharopolyspora erythraea NRRL 2338]QRK91803.1 hypothetical protein JQX30_10750 [Saccharopolyspora erythraea]CAM01347.1 hypothetical protein SACE_2039 [Saccharopolyspora erythraea NRRL 2338]
MTGPKTEIRPGASAVVRGDRESSISAELAELLRTGPFEAALRTAIRSSRLSLERIQHRLRARGTPVSITALSYWQSGRRRPERPDSLLALQQLESVLGVPEGALSALLGPPRPRGRTRQASSDAPPLSAFWADNESAVELLTRIDTSHDSKLTRLSHHDVVHVDDQGELRKIRTRKLIRAECNGADRWIIMFDGASSSETPPIIRPIRSCRLGQVLTDHARDMVVAELLFDRALARGETILIEYEIIEPPTGLNEDDHSFCRVFRLPVRQYVIELQFDPAHPPRKCESYVGDSSGQEVEQPKSLAVDRYGRTHAVALDFGMGVFGVRWDPDAPASPAPQQPSPAPRA